MIGSKQISFAPALLTGLMLSSAPLSAQVVYSENFRSPSMPGTEGTTRCDTAAGGAGTYDFPLGWLLRNVDNRTPNAAVAYVNEAWEVREDFSFNVNNCVAFSTSWYSPAGAANDFMWSPPISVPAGGAALSWKAVAYDAAYADGYEVRVMPSASGPPTGGSGVIGNQITNSTVVFSIAAENSAWTTRTVNLAAFAGQSVYVGFRNNSNDKFVLLIDDMSVIGTAPDLAAQLAAPVLPYVRVPQALAYTPVLGVSGVNVGGAALTNITANAQLLRDAGPVGSTTPSTPVATLAVGASAALPFVGSLGAISGLGTWSVRYDVLAAESEAAGVQANNTMTSPSVTVTPSELARHEGATNGSLGIGAGSGGEMGVQFTLPNTITFAGVRFGLLAHSETVDDGMGGMRPNTWAGQNITANLRGYDTTNNRPGATIIATTVAGTTVFPAAVYDLPFGTGPQTLAAGTYVVTINEPIPATFPQDGTLTLALHTSRFQPDTTWTIWPTAPGGNWGNFEDFGAAFTKTPQISLMTELNLFKDGFEEVVPVAGAGRTVGGVDADRRNAGAPLRFAYPTGQ